MQVIWIYGDMAEGEWHKQINLSAKYLFLGHFLDSKYDLV